MHRLKRIYKNCSIDEMHYFVLKAILQRCILNLVEEFTEDAWKNFANMRQSSQHIIYSTVGARAVLKWLHTRPFFGSSLLVYVEW